MLTLACTRIYAVYAHGAHFNSFVMLELVYYFVAVCGNNGRLYYISFQDTISGFKKILAGMLVTKH